MRSVSKFLLACSVLGPTAAAQSEHVSAPDVLHPAAPQLPTQQRVSDGGAPPVFEVTLDDTVPLPGDGEFGGNGEATAKGSGSPDFLGFISGDYYPPADERIDPKLVHEVRLEPTDGRGAPTAYAFVMFSKRITRARIAQLEAVGCRVLGQHPYYTLKVALPPHQIDVVGALDFVRWIGSPRDAQKVHPSLVRGLATHPSGEPLELYVNVYESDLGADSVAEVIARPSEVSPGEVIVDGDANKAALRWSSNGWQQRALEALGCEVEFYVDAQRTFRVRAPAAVLEALVRADFVQFVEAAQMVQPTHDDSTAMIMSDSARYYANGNTNTAVPVGEIDSGLSTGHSDLTYHLNGVGWDFSGSGSGAWYDACGHGTHVCGTITGDGSSSAAHRGNAPGVGADGNFGRLFNAKIFSGCGPQVVDLAAVMGVMRSTYGNTSRPMIVNNSWGSSPTGSAWTGSEFDARLVDDEVYWQHQMYVFAAGNDGSGSGTIGLQAGAKNAFTVGSVEDFRGFGTYPGNLSSFSSRGPMADTRWKPNVVAPGDSIRSLAANTFSGYTLKSGTSMAAPHVTGVAALMADNHAFYRYAPARVASALMATAVTKDNTVLTSQNDAHLQQYGAGRVEAFCANYGSNGTTWTNWGFDLGAGQGTFADVYVYPGCARLVVCMTWNEWAASAGASQATINDWDLYIDREPFTAGTNTGEYNAGLSSRNNSEIRFIENPPAGWYRWKTHPYNATTTGHVSVTTALVYGSTTPNTTLTVGQSATYLLPGELVNFDVSVFSPNWVSSATHVEVNPVGGFVQDAWRSLGDGAYDDLSDNGNGSYECQLGDILNGNSRSANFTAAWYTEGWSPFYTSAYADNVGFRYATNWVFVDGTGPSAVSNLDSTTHVVNQWDCENSIVMQWSPAVDTGIGVAGYSYEFDQLAFTDPDGFIDTYNTSETFFAPDSLAPYYVHVRAIDWLGNVGPTTHSQAYSVMSTGAWTYCTGKLNSQFCQPYMTTAGRLTLSGQDDLHLYGNDVINNKTGLLFWGVAESNAPFQGGIKCVAQPTIRTATLSSGGSPTGTDCSGVLDFAFTSAYAASYGFTAAGSVVFAQYWYRDPLDADHTGLTDAVAIILCD